MGKSILVADDSVVIQKSIGITFAQEDYNITFAQNGQDPIAQAKAINADLILVDVVGKDGYGVCQSVKADPQLQHVPVVLLAGTQVPYDQARGQTVGADGFVVKPFVSSDLIQTVSETLSKSAHPAVAAAAAAPAMPTPDQGIANPNMTIAAGLPLSTPAPVAPQASPLDLGAPIETPVAETPQGASGDDMWNFITSTDEDAALLNPEGVEPAPSGPAIDTQSLDTINLGPAEPEIVATPEPMADMAAETAEFDLGANSDADPFAAPLDLGAIEETVAEPTPAIDFTSPDPFTPPPTNPGSDLGALAGAAAVGAGALAAGGMANATAESAFASSLEQPATPSDLPPLSNSPLGSMEQTPLMAQTAEPITQAPGLGESGAISDERIEKIVKKVFRDVIERIAWEVVPDLAENIIKEELDRLIRDEES